MPAAETSNNALPPMRMLHQFLEQATDLPATKALLDSSQQMLFSGASLPSQFFSETTQVPNDFSRDDLYDILGPVDPLMRHVGSNASLSSLMLPAPSRSMFSWEEPQSVAGQHPQHDQANADLEPTPIIEKGIRTLSSNNLFMATFG
jgi:hypothetical protein